MMATGAQEAKPTEEVEKIEPEKVEKEELSTSDSELDTLKKALEESRNDAQSYKDRALKAETEKTEIVGKLHTETGNRLSAEEVAIANGLAAAISDAERLERELVEAQEQGKFADAAKLSRQLASAQNKIDRWEGDKETFERNKKAVKEQPQQKDPLATYSPAAREWIGRNPKFLTDAKMNAKVMAAHYAATAEGIDVDSEEYFRHLDTAVKGKPVQVEQPREEEVQEERQETQPHKPANRTAAPPSRGASNTSMSGNKGNGDIKLSPQQVEAAIFANPRLSSADAIVKYKEGLQKAVQSGKMTADGKYVG